MMQSLSTPLMLGYRILLPRELYSAARISHPLLSHANLKKVRFGHAFLKMGIYRAEVEGLKKDKKL